MNKQSIFDETNVTEEISGDIRRGIFPASMVGTGKSSTSGEDLLEMLQDALVISIAGREVNSAGIQLPYMDKIQKSFGKHDITNIHAHLAPHANDYLGTQAYTMGNHVAFAHYPPLCIAAHEAAHVIQQRAGIQLRGSVGRSGDKYEKIADQVAELVVSGQSAEKLLDRIVDEGACSSGVKKKAVQFWGKQHFDFTRRAIDKWNTKHPARSPMHIPAHLKQRIIDCSDDPDHTGRAFVILGGGFKYQYDLRIYIDFFAQSKEKRHKEYAAASPATKKELEAAARKAICASEGPAHGEGKRPNYGSSGGVKANQDWMMSQIKMANTLTFGKGFLSPAGAGQLGDAMHCAQDRGSHCEGARHKGHDDVRDILGIGKYDTDDPTKNTIGKRVADQLSDMVLSEYAKIRQPYI